MTRLDEIKKDFASANPDLKYTSMMREDIQYLLDLVEKQNDYLASKAIWKARAESAEKLVERYETALNEIVKADQFADLTTWYSDVAQQALNKEGE